MDILNHRGRLILPGDHQSTLRFSVNQLIEIGKQAIEERGFFSIALSGGQTPNAIFKELSSPGWLTSLDWSRVLCFWSDERAVSPESPESNYFNAMEAGLSRLPLKKEHLFRMEAEKEILLQAERYEEVIKEKIPSSRFDLVMLGMGEDGHTASLFPHTEALSIQNKKVVANYLPQKKSWRMTLTYSCINDARHISIYVFGESKAETVVKVLESPYQPENLPIQKVGTVKNPAHWILDQAAASLLLKKGKE